jgi:hypothetical protein
MTHRIIALNKRTSNPSRIDITQLRDLRFWSYKFGCTIEQLRAAVKAVGDDAAAVTNYFLRVATFKQALAV